MRLVIECEIDDDGPLTDWDHPMGVTNEGYEAIVHALLAVGLDDVDVHAEQEHR